MTNIILISIIISLNILFILIGYILGKMSGLSIKSTTIETKNNDTNQQSFFKKQKQHDQSKNTSTIDIDERKVVVAIKTDGLEKKYDSLGDIKTSSDDISSSINKLKNMKGL